MRTLVQSGVVALGLFVGAAVALSGCHEKPAKKECEAAAKKRVRYFFGGSKDTGSDRQTKRASKLEFSNTVDECMSSWSKDKANCIAKSTNRNSMISCK